MDRQGYQRATPRAGEGENLAGTGADYGKFHDRLDEIAARLDRLARRAQTRGPASTDHDVSRAMPEGQFGDARGRLDPRVDEPEARRERARPAAAAGLSFNLDDAIAEISARQEALDAEAAAPAVAPAVDLSGVERLLHNITDQIDSLRRPSAVEESIEALRRELGDIGRAVAEPRPQPSLDAVQAELRALAERIDRRPPVVEAPALSALERGLNEVRDALNARPPAPAVTAFGDDAPAFVRNGTDAATLDHLDSAIAELRNVSTRVASGDQLAALATDVRTLGTKLDRVAPSAAPADGMEDLIRRMDALAVALESHPRPGEAAEGGQIEVQLRRLTDKLDTVEAAADQRGFQQLEAQLARLTQKLDAADARLGHLDTIEHAVADLVEQLQDARVGALDAAEQAARAAVREMMGASANADVDALKHELADFRATQADIEARLGRRRDFQTTPAADDRHRRPAARARHVPAGEQFPCRATGPDRDDRRAGGSAHCRAFSQPLAERGRADAPAGRAAGARAPVRERSGGCRRREDRPCRGSADAPAGGRRRAARAEGECPRAVPGLTRNPDHHNPARGHRIDRRAAARRVSCAVDPGAGHRKAAAGRSRAGAAQRRARRQSRRRIRTRLALHRRARRSAEPPGGGALARARRQPRPRPRAVPAGKPVREGPRGEERPRGGAPPLYRRRQQGERQGDA